MVDGALLFLIFFFSEVYNGLRLRLNPILYVRALCVLGCGLLFRVLGNFGCREHVRII